ncbi:MAG: DUF1476 domain-containing protein [Xanthobacteraceae bacterium]|nr:DUF1476 domain-containing protein [Xanthobacteraceae bacterium]
MTTFDKREQGFESKFVHDEELRFKATARRNRLLGMWAAAKLGLAGEAASAYANYLVDFGLEESGAEATLHMVSKDLASKGISEQEIALRMDELFRAAVEQIQAGK